MTPVLLALLLLPCDSWIRTEPALNTTIVSTCPHTAIMSWRDPSGGMEYTRWLNAMSYADGEQKPVLVKMDNPKLAKQKRGKHKKKRRRR